MPVEPILVTGAAGGIQGSTGFHVTRLLLDKGWPVRAFVHRLDDRSDRLRTLGAEVVDGDLRDFRSVAAAMGGIRRAYFAYPVQEGLLDAAATFAAAARSAGVEQVVNLSQWLQEGGEQPTRTEPATGWSSRSSTGPTSAPCISTPLSSMKTSALGPCSAWPGLG